MNQLLIIAGTTGYSFQMTVAVNMGKTGSSIKSAEITGIYRSNQTTKILVLLCYQNVKNFPSQMPQVLPPPPQQQQPQLQQQQQQQLQLKLILFLEIGLLFNTVDNMATLLIHLPSVYHYHLKIESFQKKFHPGVLFLKLIFPSFPSTDDHWS